MPQEAWGGDVQMPRWMRKLMHRPDPPGDTPERVHESRQSQDGPTVGENVDKAVAGGITQIYWEDRTKASPRRDKR
jgi:hypothetical protein